MSRVILLHYSGPPIVGGVEGILEKHAVLMAEAGHSVNLVVGEGEPFDDRVPVTVLPRLSSAHPGVLRVKAALDRGAVPLEFKALAAAIGEELRGATAGADVIIAHNVCGLHKNLPLTAALRELSGTQGGPRLVAWIHDLAWTAGQYTSELHEGHPWELLRTAWPGVRYVTISAFRRAELAQLTGLPRDAITVVPNGVDVDRFLGLTPRVSALVRELGLLAAEPLFLLPVRITRRKNIELALRTLAALRGDLTAAGLVVTGPVGHHNPANRAYLQQLIDLRQELGLDGAVHFLAEVLTEPLAEPDVAALYRLADALLLPSREEGFGLPLLEAGLAGMPAFCADLLPLREIGDEWVTWFSPSAEPRAVAALIRDRLAADMTRRLRAHVKRCYPWEAVYSDHIAPLLGD